MENYAPVLILTLNRFEHFRRCVESLARCTYADKTELFIALDYPANDTHWEGYKKIKEYCNNISGFKKVHILERSTNYGVLKNFLEARKVIYSRFGSLILTEDDNEFSPNFLDYINKGLEKYKYDDKVFAVCGYSFPDKFILQYEYSHYFYKRLSAWGVGMWRSKSPKDIEWSYKKLSKFMKNKSYSRILKRIAERHYYRVLVCIRNKQSMYGDLVYLLICIQNNQYCVYPKLSKVRNYGHDGTGIHCGQVQDDIYSVQVIDADKYYEYDENVQYYDEKIHQEISNSLKMTKREKIIFIMKMFKMFPLYQFIKQRRGDNSNETNSS
jgi:hypothetical protein